jgi:hypothetical protein
LEHVFSSVSEDIVKRQTTENRILILGSCCQKNGISEVPEEKKGIPSAIPDE